MQNEIQEKLGRLVRMITDESLGGVLINSQPNFAWLTAGGTNGVDSSRESGVGTLFVRRDGRKFVLANRIELPRLLTDELSGQDYEPVEFGWEEERATPDVVVELARKLGSDGLPFGSDVSLGNSTRVIDRAIARMRYRLTDAEMDRFRSLGRDAGEAIGNVARAAIPGLTERELAGEANDALEKIGAHSIVTLVAADDRIERFRHPVPTDLRWHKTVMIVVCARRQGLIASLTRIVCVGDVPDDLFQRTELTASVNAKLLNATKPGASGANLYEVAAGAYREAGFPGEEHLHHQGGATGYRTRDWLAHPQSTELVQVHQAFAWNPSITGTKVEETCLVLDSGVELITTTSEWPSIPVEVNGRNYFLPGILSV